MGAAGQTEPRPLSPPSPPPGPFLPPGVSSLCQPMIHPCQRQGPRRVLLCPHTHPPSVGLGPVRPNSLPRCVWKPGQGTFQPGNEQRKTQRQPLSTTTQEPHSRPSRRLHCLALMSAQRTGMLSLALFPQVPSL